MANCGGRSRPSLEVRICGLSAWPSGLAFCCCSSSQRGTDVIACKITSSESGESLSGQFSLPLYYCSRPSEHLSRNEKYSDTPRLHCCSVFRAGRAFSSALQCTNSGCLIRRLTIMDKLEWKQPRRFLPTCRKTNYSAR